MFKPHDYAHECPRCQIGRCHPSKTTHMRMVNGHAISIPNITMYTCDICGFQELDPDALLRLQVLLGTVSNNPQEDNRPMTKPATLDAPDTGKSPRPKP